MGKPYSDLEKRAIAILAGGGDPGASQDEGLAKYWRWKLNPSATSHNLPEASSRTAGRKLDDVTIKPFGLALAGTALAKVTISQRSLAFVDSKKTDLGIGVIAADTTAYRLGKFKPARVYARKGASATSEERLSRITGRRYKSYYGAPDEGYSAPFGIKTAGDTQLERQSAVAAAVKALDTTINLITFTPEKVRV